MRIPLYKIYRAFPELDRFSDPQCERYVRQATRLAPWRRAIRLLIEAAVGLACFLLVLAAGIVALPNVLPQNPAMWLYPTILLSYMALLAGAPVIAWLVARDQILRRAIALRLKSARCPACDYSLLGLPAGDGRVQCPECGEEIEMERHGLAAEDLLSEPARGTVTSDARPGSA